MKTRTTEQLVESMANEMSWRHKELSELKFVVAGASRGVTHQKVMTRAAVALLYAHWEGFVKAAAEVYLEFVAMQRCQNSDLADNMLAIILRSKLHAAHASKKIAAHANIVAFFRTQMQQRSALPYKDVLRTEANLSSAVLLDILRTLGLPTREYEPKCHMIDAQLVAKRNHIAHGSALGVESTDYLQLHDEILSLMNLLRNQIENAAVNREYLRP